MAKYRRSYRRNDKTGLIWTAVMAEGVNTAPGFVEQIPCVEMVTDVSFGGVESHATFMRMRGNLSIAIVPEVDSSAFAFYQPIFLALYKHDDQDATLNPCNIVDYTQEDILWTHQLMLSGYVGPAANTGTIWQVPNEINIDVKVKRKLETGQSLSLLIGNDTNTAGFGRRNIRTAGVLRSLLKLR